MPAKGGSVEDLKKFINVATQYDFPLIVSYLLAALRGRGPYPVIVLLGVAGAAKSTTLRLFKALVDPTKAPLRPPLRNDRDLFIAANNSYLIAFDNLSKLEDWLSDAFCRLATGGGYSTRQLYTDEEEQIFEAMRPLAINAIGNVVIRGDLADRSIFITLMLIPDDRRQPEDEFWAAFDALHAGILGALLDMVAHGLRELPNVRLTEYPRMADFTKWGTACEGALWPPGTFAEAYRINRTHATVDIVEADLVASAVTAFMQARADDEYAEDQYSWKGESGELLKLLERHVTEAQVKSKHWPKATNALSNRLTRALPALRKTGIEIQEGRDEKTRRKVWTIVRPRPPGPENDPSVSSDPSKAIYSNRLGPEGSRSYDPRRRIGEPSPQPYAKDDDSIAEDGSDSSFLDKLFADNDFEGSKDAKDSLPNAEGSPGATRYLRREDLRRLRDRRRRKRKA
jgi:hypothetical protein